MLRRRGPDAAFAQLLHIETAVTAERFPAALAAGFLFATWPCRTIGGWPAEREEEAGDRRCCLSGFGPQPLERGRPCGVAGPEDGGFAAEAGGAAGENGVGQRLLVAAGNGKFGLDHRAALRRPVGIGEDGVKGDVGRAEIRRIEALDDLSQRFQMGLGQGAGENDMLGRRQRRVEIQALGLPAA